MTRAVTFKITEKALREVPEQGQYVREMAKTLLGGAEKFAVEAKPFTVEVSPGGPRAYTFVAWIVE